MRTLVTVSIEDVPVFTTTIAAANVVSFRQMLIAKSGDMYLAAERAAKEASRKAASQAKAQAEKAEPKKEPQDERKAGEGKAQTGGDAASDSERGDKAGGGKSSRKK